MKDLLGLFNSVACQCFESFPRPPVFLVCVSIHFGIAMKSTIPRSDSRFSCALLRLQSAGLQHSWQGAEPWKDFSETACFLTSFALEGTRSKMILKPTLQAQQHKEGQSWITSRTPGSRYTVGTAKTCSWKSMFLQTCRAAGSAALISLYPLSSSTSMGLRCALVPRADGPEVTLVQQGSWIAIWAKKRVQPFGLEVFQGLLVPTDLMALFLPAPAGVLLSLCIISSE